MIKRLKFNFQLGASQIFVFLVMIILAAVLAVEIKLVQTNQENRSRAEGYEIGSICSEANQCISNKCIGGRCVEPESTCNHYNGPTTCSNVADECTYSQKIVEDQVVEYYECHNPADGKKYWHNTSEWGCIMTNSYYSDLLFCMLSLPGEKCYTSLKACQGIDSANPPGGEPTNKPTGLPSVPPILTSTPTSTPIPSGKPNFVWTIKSNVYCPTGKVLDAATAVRYSSSSSLIPNWQFGPVLVGYRETVINAKSTDVVVAYDMFRENSGIYLNPSGTPPHKSISYNTFLTESHKTAFWTPKDLPAGTYQIDFYTDNNKICFAPTPTITSTPTPGNKGPAKLSFYFSLAGIKSNTLCKNNLLKEIKVNLINKTSNVNESYVIAQKDIKTLSEQVNKNNDQVFSVESLSLTSKFNNANTNNVFRIKGVRHAQMRYCKNNQGGKIIDDTVCDIKLDGTIYDFRNYPVLPGDVTGETAGVGNGIINGQDYSYVKTRLNAGGVPDCGKANVKEADLNGDGVVNGIDIQLIKNSLGTRDDE